MVAGGPLFAFAGGGTGGHLYPALSAAEALRERVPDARFVFLATTRPIDRQIVSTIEPSAEFVPQKLPRLRLAPWTWPGLAIGLSRNMQACKRLLHKLRPAAVVGSGGMASFGPIWQAARQGIPTVLLNPDAKPGRANHFLARRAQLVCVQWSESMAYLSRASRVEVTGCAVRPGFRTGGATGTHAEFGLNPDLKTLLVTGASLGARTLNDAVLHIADALSRRADWQVLHLTGEYDYDRVSAAYRGRPLRGNVLAYTDRMAEAMRLADLIVSRAGASTLAEITALGRASVLLPYPFHRDMHQLANARCLSDRLAARVVRDAVKPNVTGPALLEILEFLMEADGERAAMAEAARRMGRPNAHRDIADRILQTCGLAPGSGSRESIQARP